MGEQRRVGGKSHSYLIKEKERIDSKLSLAEVIQVQTLTIMFGILLMMVIHMHSRGVIFNYNFFRLLF